MEGVKPLLMLLARSDLVRALGFLGIITLLRVKFLWYFLLQNQIFKAVVSLCNVENLGMMQKS